jgi:lipoyl(octanoyl) transferase
MNLDQAALSWSWLGLQPYAKVHQAQQDRRQAVIDGHKPEVLWLLEHSPVITTGRRPVPGLPSAETLHDLGIALHHTERGGLATYHGPGQLVVYAIIDAAARKLGVRGTICAMETAIINTLAGLGIDGHRRYGFPGVWVDRKKICAIGMHFRRGVSMHGVALNLNPDLKRFQLFVPCGITDGAVGSVAELIDTCPTPIELAPILADNMVNALTKPMPREASAIRPRLTAAQGNDSSRPFEGM